MRYTLIFLLLSLSCASNKDVLFIQDSDSFSDYKVTYQSVKIKADDILKIKVSAQSPELAELFSFNQSQNLASSLESYQLNGYLVDSAGFVKIPLLKPIMVKDLTLFEAASLVEKSLKEQGFLLNASVDIKILNSYFTVLGEVNMPGRYNFLKNNMDIFQALGLAGDLTINGKRDDIKILRKIDNNLKVSSIDITKSEIFSSENFQIFPGDIIIVNPNRARVKNAGVIGNSGNLLSVLSFLLSSLILLTNMNS